jgi:hypothetical protein
LQYASTGQEARAEEENAKMANSWLALKGDQENARQLRLEARLAELLRTTAAPCWAGAEHLSGYLMEGFVAGAWHRVAPAAGVPI